MVCRVNTVCKNLHWPTSELSVEKNNLPLLPKLFVSVKILNITNFLAKPANSFQQNGLLGEPGVHKPSLDHPRIIRGKK